MYKIHKTITMLIFLSVVHGKDLVGHKRSDTDDPPELSQVITVEERESTYTPTRSTFQIEDPVWHAYAKPKIAWINEKASRAKNRHYFRNPFRKWLIAENSGAQTRNSRMLGALACALVVLL